MLFNSALRTNYSDGSRKLNEVGNKPALGSGFLAIL